MTHSHASRIAFLALLPLALLLPALPAFSDAATDAAKQQAKREEWVQKHEELKAKTSRLEAELSQARVDYSRGRSTRHLRGEGKTGLLTEIDRLEKEVAESEAELQNFPEDARRQGALPGWFRDDGEDEAPAAQAAGAAADRESRFGSGSSDSLSRRSSRSRQEREEPPEAKASDGDSSRGSLSDRRREDRSRRRLGRD